MCALQVCWIPIFKAQKLILAGDPMQLPPTIISIDKNKKEKSKRKVSSDSKAATATKSSTSTTKPAGKSASKVIAKDEDNDDDDDDDEASADEGQSGSSDDEGDPALTADPDEPLKSAPKDPRKAGSRPVLRPPRTLETTLFERLEKMYGPGIKRMLTVQYRSVHAHEHWLPGPLSD